MLILLIGTIILIIALIISIFNIIYYKNLAIITSYLFIEIILYIINSYPEYKSEITSHISATINNRLHDKYTPQEIIKILTLLQNELLNNTEYKDKEVPEQTIKWEGMIRQTSLHDWMAKNPLPFTEKEIQEFLNKDSKENSNNE